MSGQHQNADRKLQSYGLDEEDHEARVLLDQDREQVLSDQMEGESMQLRDEEPVSELYIWGSK